MTLARPPPPRDVPAPALNRLGSFSEDLAALAAAALTFLDVDPQGLLSAIGPARCEARLTGDGAVVDSCARNEPRGGRGRPRVGLGAALLERASVATVSWQIS